MIIVSSTETIKSITTCYIFMKPIQQCHQRIYIKIWNKISQKLRSFFQNINIS